MDANYYGADPTAYDLQAEATAHDEEYSPDPRIRRLNAWSNYGNFRLRMPYMTPIDDNLWHGGVETGLELPTFIKHIVSLYPWEGYKPHEHVVSSVQYKLYDHHEQDLGAIDAIANWVNEMRQDAPTLVHCQAGINRSSLVVARALFLNGDVTTGQEAIDLIRSKRDPSCLCNPGFEAAVRGWGA